jgi:hypothetical protein
MLLTALVIGVVIGVVLGTPAIVWLNRHGRAPLKAARVRIRTTKAALAVGGAVAQDRGRVGP